MLAQELKKEEIEVKRAITKKLQEEGADSKVLMPVPQGESKKKRRWDEGDATPMAASEWDHTDDLPKAKSKWDETPNEASKPKSRWDETPDALSAASGRPSAWDATPGSTPGGRKRSRWDETPLPG